MSEPNSGLGRRAEALEDATRVRVIAAGSVQNRHVRRNNLRVARVKARAERKAAERAAVVEAQRLSVEIL